MSTPPTSQLQIPNPKIQNLKSTPVRQAVQNLPLALLLFLYLATALAYAALAPLTTGPDELAHYEYVRFITEHGRLPLTNEERQQASYKSDQPPLYHLIAALPAVLVDPTGPPFLKRVGDDPRRQLIERTRHAWGLYNTEDERWPYRAEILRWHIGRWVAIFFGVATVAVTFFVARNVFVAFQMTGDRRPETGQKQQPLPPPRGRVGEGVLALAAAATVAFIPRFGLTGAMLNYETTVAFFATLFLWTLLRMVNGKWQMANGEWQIANGEWRIASPPTSHIPYPASRLPPPALLLGLFAGLAILTKLSALILLLEIIIGLWLISRSQNWPRRVWLQTTLTALATAFIIAGLWVGFVLYTFNTVAADGLWSGLLRPLVAADSSDATTNQLLSFLTGGQAGFTGAIENLESGPPWDWAKLFFRTFWLVPIENVQPLAPTAITIALALCLLAAYGLIRTRRDGGRGPETGDRESSPLTQPPAPYSLLPILTLHLGLPILLPLLRYAATFSLADTAQGRHVLFLAAPAFATLLIWGLSSLTLQSAASPWDASRRSLPLGHFTLYASRFTPPASSPFSQLCFCSYGPPPISGP